jgi:hypothetical protein
MKNMMQKGAAGRTTPTSSRTDTGNAEARTRRGRPAAEVPAMTARQSEKAVAFPLFVEAEDGTFLLALNGDIWRVGRIVYLRFKDRWFRLGTTWEKDLEGGRHRTDAWLAYRDAALVTMEQRRRVLLSIAEAVGKRQDGLKTIRMMQVALRSAFGLDVFGGEDATATFAAWRVEFQRRVRPFG